MTSGISVPCDVVQVAQKLDMSWDVFRFKT